MRIRTALEEQKFKDTWNAILRMIHKNTSKVVEDVSSKLK